MARMQRISTTASIDLMADPYDTWEAFEIMDQEDNQEYLQRFGYTQGEEWE